MPVSIELYTNYLLVHFIGEQSDGEQVYFAWSDDGLHWHDLNNGLPILRSDLGEQGIRDPFLIRSPDHAKCARFHIIATDLRIGSGKGWEAAVNEGSRDIIIWESDDLVNWSTPRSVTVGALDAGCVWAPEAIYDETTDEFLVFWASSTFSGGTTRKQKVYSSRTSDFFTFTSAELYIERDNHIIDTTIIADRKMYYRYSKDETTKNIRVEKSHSLRPETFTSVSAPELEALTGVEGPQIFQLNDATGWCLIIDRFAEGKGYLPLLTSDLDSGDFRILSEDEFDMGMSQKRHGGVLAVTSNEIKRLRNAFG